MRELLKLLCPLKKLNLSADDMYFVKREDIAPWRDMGYLHLFKFLLLPHVATKLLKLENMSQCVCFLKKYKVDNRGRDFESFLFSLSASGFQFKKIYEETCADRMVWVTWLFCLIG